MKNYFKSALVCCVMLCAFAACTGHSDRDGFKSMEGSADPANDGGKLGGEHAPARVHSSDSTAVNDTVQ